MRMFERRESRSNPGVRFPESNLFRVMDHADDGRA
jgi:hypothetical protein